uniref:Uncharacterized protein n=1 Tax=Arundo donax TaxID=35708 RepID=A0A0A9HUN1_ARUDO
MCQEVARYHYRGGHSDSRGKTRSERTTTNNEPYTTLS